MEKRLVALLKRPRLWSRVRVLMALALALPALGIFAHPAMPGAAQTRVQPELFALAQSRPDASVEIIVQKNVADRGPEYAVKGLGGTLTKDLNIINAFAATVPARLVSEIGKIDGVRWVSLDAPINEMGDVELKGDGTADDAAGDTGAKGGQNENPGPLFNTLPVEFTTWATGMVASGTSEISSGFTSTTIRAGSTLWFSSVMRATNLGSGPTTISLDNTSIQVSIGGQQFNATLPDATITFSPNVSTATTTYDSVTGEWITLVPMRLANSDVFLTGASVFVPFDIAGQATAVTVSGRFTSDTAGVSIPSWQWAASTYSVFSTNNNSLGIKPCDDGTASQWRNSDNAGTPENFKSYVIPGARGNGGTNYTGDYSPAASVSPARTFYDTENILDGGQGPNGTFGYGTNAAQTFSGFAAELNPGQRISRLEATFKAYVPTRLSDIEDMRLSIIVGGQTVRTVTIPNTTFDNKIGLANAGTVTVDLTSGRTWTWGDFDNGMQIKLDQSMFSTSHRVYYDAVGIHVMTTAGTDNTGGITPPTQSNKMPDLAGMRSAFAKSTKATDVWATRQGQGVTVAVVDSGVLKTKDLEGRLLAAANFNDDEHDSNDSYGHGTFVAGIIAGDGDDSDGAYMGVAPKASILNVRISGDNGAATESDTIEALQWLMANKARYNVRVVNLSLNASVMQSYHTSPLCAAVEVLWFNRMVVVVSAGNNGTANLYPPANDPFVITVGATDDRGTPSISDDTLATFSAWGTTETGAVKPEIVAPGRSIVSLLPKNIATTIGRQHPTARVDDNYFRMSGTSMAAPMVSGGVALLLQDEPTLNPDQVKYRLMATAGKTSRWPAYDPQRAGAGYLDVYAALTGTTTQSANTGTRASQLLWTGSEPVNWGSVNWGSVNWGSVNWGSVNWGSVNWGSVNWASDTWEP